MKTLVVGWFSFERMGATAGDLLARDLVCQWLGRAGHTYDVALAFPFSGGVDWRSVDPKSYSHVVFVCGPFGNGWPIPEFLARFAGCCLVGINLSMIEPLEVWNPFDFLLERDSSARSRPEIAFLSDQGHVPVVGVVEVHPQREYRERSTHQIANDPIAGGAKIRRQAETIGWPIVFTVDTLTDEALQRAFDYCLTTGARAKARECCEWAMKTAQAVRDECITLLAHAGGNVER